MAIYKNISIKICGNPDANSGFVPIIFFNNPSFVVEDQFYVGFDNCSYFYTIRTTKTQTIYKLVKNNVRSYGATRAGSLVIAFSVPKNYTIDGGKTPYDVLEKLKNEFLKKSMTCKDPVRETYEFNPGRINQHVLDEVAGEFTISPQLSPDRIMNPSAPKGYIVKSDVEIEKLFHDINYPEFDNYSEVIIAETVNQTSYIPINNIQIPRLKNYAIYVDGTYKISCTDVNQTLTVSSNKSSDYYDNNSVEFSIQNLKDGDIFSGIELQEVNERVIISTKGWATPKTRKIKLQIVPSEYENYFFTHRHLLKLTCSYGRIELDENLSFTLVGEQISEIKNDTIHLELEQNEKYTLSKFAFNGNELKVTVDKIKRQPTRNVQGAGLNRYWQQGKTTGLQSLNTLPVYDVSISLKGKEKFKESYEINLKLKTYSDNFNKTVVSCRTRFKPISTDVFESHFYVPKDNLPKDLYLCFRIGDNDYVTNEPLSFDNGKAVIIEDDFTVSKVKPFYKKASSLIKLLIIFMAILLGLIIGYASHDTIKNLSSETKTSDEMPIDAGGGEGLPSMTEDEAIAFLTNADSVLNTKDLTFGAVITFYDKYQTNKDTIDKVDTEKFGTKVCGRIIDYNKVVSYIKNGELENLKETLTAEGLHIWLQHRKLAEKIVKDEISQDQFMNNYSNITGFADIENFINVETGTGVDNNAAAGSDTPATEVSTYKCDKCSKSFTSKRELDKHKKEKHASQNRYECSKCNPSLFFNTQKELENHIKTFHSGPR